MRVALIQPIPNLGHFEPTRVNLILAHLLKNDTYFRYYHNRGIMGDFTILDNGAHEGQAFEFEHLLEMAHKVCAREVAIQDEPHNTDMTFELFCSSIDWLNTKKGREKYIALEHPRLMFVPQVPARFEAANEYLKLADDMIAYINENSWIGIEHFTMGVALMYECLAGGLPGLLGRIANMFAGKRAPKIHMLGWSRVMDSPIIIRQRYPSLVRSIDTAKPYVFGSKDKFLLIDRHGDLLTPEYPGRDHDYFTTRLDRRQAYIGNYNASLLQALLFNPVLRGMHKSSTDLSAKNWDTTLGPSVGLPDTSGVEEREVT